jgi:hypothetical protein
LRFRQLLLDLVGIQEAFGNSLPPLFKCAENGLIGEALHEERDDDKADYLRQEDPDVETELLAGFARHIDDSASGGKDGNVHRE